MSLNWLKDEVPAVTIEARPPEAVAMITSRSAMLSPWSGRSGLAALHTVLRAVQQHAALICASVAGGDPTIAELSWSSLEKEAGVWI